MEISIKWNVCRVCLQEEPIEIGNGMKRIFNDAKLVNQIYECSGVMMRSDDCLPEKICRKCLMILRYAVNFRTTCRNSDEYLQSVLQKTKSATSLFKLDRQREETFELVGGVIDEIFDGADENEAHGDSVKPKVMWSINRDTQRAYTRKKIKVEMEDKAEEICVPMEDAATQMHCELDNVLELDATSVPQTDSALTMTNESVEQNIIELFVDEEELDHEDEFQENDVEEYDDEQECKKAYTCKITSVCSIEDDGFIEEGDEEDEQLEAMLAGKVQVQQQHQQHTKNNCISASSSTSSGSNNTTDDQVNKCVASDVEEPIHDTTKKTTITKTTITTSTSSSLSTTTTTTTTKKENIDDDNDTKELFYVLGSNDIKRNYDDCNDEDDDFDDNNVVNQKLAIAETIDYVQLDAVIERDVDDDDDENAEVASLCNNIANSGDSDNNIRQLAPLEENNLEDEEDEEDDKYMSAENVEYMECESADENSASATELQAKSAQTTLGSSAAISIVNKKRCCNTPSSALRKDANAKDVNLLICDVCGNRFTNRSLMNYHMRIHRNERNYECELCFKRFNAACNLSAHMRIHTGEKPFKCQYCGRRFTDRSTQIKHERLHTNEKPYTCKVCNKSFALSDTLRAHERIHTGEKPYRCEPCAKSFKLAHQLKAHLSTHLHQVLAIKQ